MAMELFPYHVAAQSKTCGVYDHRYAFYKKGIVQHVTDSGHSGNGLSSKPFEHFNLIDGAIAAPGLKELTVKY